MVEEKLMIRLKKMMGGINNKKLVDNVLKSGHCIFNERGMK